MPKFGKKSRAVLDTVDPWIVQICEAVIPHRDFSCLSGRRFESEQNEYYRRKRSTKKFPHSKHNITAEGNVVESDDDLVMAIDVAPYPIRWDDENEFILLAGRIQQAANELGIDIRWGGNWDMDDDAIDDQTFQDLGHFELVI